MKKILAFVIIVGLISCSTVEVPKVSAFEEAINISKEIDNMKLAGEFEELEKWAILEAPKFVISYNLKHLEAKLLPATGTFFAIWIITKGSMDRLYLQLLGGYGPFDTTFMVAFCWQSSQIIILTRDNKGDLYHEIGHAQFPSGGEEVAEAFRKWCELK
jgi:hypothetical protein